MMDYLQSAKNIRENILEEELRNLVSLWNDLNADKLFYKGTGYIRAKKM
jgi:hypothetical protein